jgi:methionyl-tRNA synthetase
MSKFYITTSIVYANGNPHLGFAMEQTQADVLARYHRLILDGTYFLTGTDEHGIKIYQTAAKESTPTHEFVDHKAAAYHQLTQALNLSNDDFIRTSDQQRHWPGVVKMWQTLLDRGDLYKKTYKGLYSVRAERFVTQKELDEDQGREHGQVIEIEEENYFFALSKYQDRLRQLIQSDTLKIVPESKKREMLEFIDQGLDDISFSRAKDKLPWGIPVPNDDNQVMYVWCDALTNYISALGYGTKQDELFQTFWPADVHLIGKDIIRFHAIFWPAMLLSANLPLPKQLFVHGFITVDGQKMSKSIGNVIDPFEFIDAYGADPFRYFMLRELPTTEDGDFSRDRFRQRYNDDLANGLGNLVARVAKLCEKSGKSFDAKPQNPQQHPAYCTAIEHFELNRALEYVWTLIRVADQFVDTTKPWTLEGDDLHRVLKKLVNDISTIAVLLQPFLPHTAEKILAQYSASHIQSSTALFPRLT